MWKWTEKEPRMIQCPPEYRDNRTTTAAAPGPPRMSFIGTARVGAVRTLSRPVLRQSTVRRQHALTAY